MKRPARHLVVAVLALVAACAPLREIGVTFRPTQPTNLAPGSPFTQAMRDPAQCQAILRSVGVAFTPVADRREGEFCDVRNAILLGATPVRVLPQRPMMTCPLAAAFLLWTRYSVEPASRQILGTELRQVDHFGVYSCRRVNNASVGRPSAHARAEAIDVAGFRFANGRQIKVLGDWSKSGPEGQFLHRVREDACRAFSTVLSPDYNELHHNHLHLEIGGTGPCG